MGAGRVAAAAAAAGAARRTRPSRVCVRDGKEDGGRRNGEHGVRSGRMTSSTPDRARGRATPSPHTIASLRALRRSHAPRNAGEPISRLDCLMRPRGTRTASGWRCALPRTFPSRDGELERGTPLCSLGVRLVRRHRNRRDPEPGGSTDGTPHTPGRDPVPRTRASGRTGQRQAR